jgi:hypothetical protein
MSGLLREARLRERFANLYPGLVAGLWLPAAEVAEHIASVVRHRWRPSGGRGRLMANEHFDFAGGPPITPGRSNCKERWDDNLTDQ